MNYRKGCLQRLAVVLACVLFAIMGRVAHGQGGPPLITEDPGTPGAGNWEINIAGTLEQRQDERVLEAPVLDINYGLGERIQLKYEIPRIVLDEEGEGTINGLGTSEVGIKYRFLDYEHDGVSMSVYPQYEFNNPGSSSEERGLVDDNELLLPVQIARPIGPVEVSVELGYALIESESDEWFYGVAVGYPLNDRITLLGEIFGTATEDFAEDELIFNLGVEYAINENMNLLFSLGRSFRESDSGEPELLGYLGVQFLF